MQDCQDLLTHRASGSASWLDRLAEREALGLGERSAMSLEALLVLVRESAEDAGEGRPLCSADAQAIPHQAVTATRAWYLVISLKRLFVLNLVKPPV
jgi:hypothetical protein